MKIPYIGQLAGANPPRLYSTITDAAAAKKFGCRLYKEFSYWAWRACAISAIAMILAAEGLLKETLYDLICEALQMHGYAYRNRRGHTDIGWKHSVLCSMLEKRGLSTQRLPRLNLATVTQLLNEGKYVIVSVKSDTGGHMVLVTDINTKQIIYHDPLHFQNHGGENVEESLEAFGNRFLGKGIAAW